MLVASELKAGMVIRMEGQIYRVLEVESRAGAAKLGGVVKAKLSNVRSGGMSEPHLRPLERVEELHVERQLMEFLFRQGSTYTFMNPNTYEQIEVSGEMLGPAGQFLQAGMEVPVEFFEGEPISAVLPDIMEARVLDTVPPTRSQQDSAWKEARLDNGLVIRVPLFIAPGESVRVDLRTGHYVERAHVERSRTA
ncbi:MAG: elongation factor P [Acidobacteriia bacterium]|nr:elongation factor P [Terriglobia bacterium]